MLLYLERELILVHNKNRRDGSNAQLLMFWRFKSRVSWQSYSGNLIYCFHVPILNTSVYFYSQDFSRNKNRSASLLKTKVYIIPVGKSEVQEKRQFPSMLYDGLRFSSSVMCWHYIVCLPVIKNIVFSSLKQNKTLSLDCMYPNGVITNLVIFREAISFVLLNFVPCLGIRVTVDL